MQCTGHVESLAAGSVVALVHPGDVAVAEARDNQGAIEGGVGREGDNHALGRISMKARFWRPPLKRAMRSKIFFMKPYLRLSRLLAWAYSDSLSRRAVAGWVGPSRLPERSQGPRITAALLRMRLTLPAAWVMIVS